MISRRNFLKLGAAAAAGFFVPIRLPDGQKTYLFVPVQTAQATLPPGSIPKYQTPLIVPPAMPRVSEITLPDGSPADYYEITVKQFTQHILPPALGLGPTPVWSFVKTDDPSTYNYPGFSIEATVDKPVRVKWINGLVDEGGHYLPHLTPIDQTLHWANPPGPRDDHGHSQTPYTGPVPMVVHVHGAHVEEESDGFPEAWFLPNAANIPATFFKEGTFYNRFKEKFASLWGETWEPGTATFQYPNDQRASTLWFHDHVLGVTRNNVYAGPAGFYLLRGGPDDLAPSVLPGPAPAAGADPFGTHFEIPIAIQDRTFNADGTLFYPNHRAFFEGLEPSQLQVPFSPDPGCDGVISHIAPIWNPEFFGDTIVVNGRTWPNLNVQRRRYRFRLLNGCSSRFLILKLVSQDPAVSPPSTSAAALPFWVIGNEGGFLPQPVQVNELLMGPAERYDVIVDFGALPEGTTAIYMANLGPDEPFGGGTPGVDFTPADPLTTGQVMKFTVGPIVGTDSSADPATLALPEIPALGAADKIRQLSLIELHSTNVRVETLEDGTIVVACDDPEAEFFGPTEAHLGIVTPTGQARDLGWDEPPTEFVTLDETEIWEIFNFTVDAHPIHVHLVHFEVVNRQPLATDEEGMALQPPVFVGDPISPDATEAGLKETVIALPGQVTRIKAKFDKAGMYVWHCHILEHEDNEMMRPYQVVRRTWFPIINRR